MTRARIDDAKGWNGIGLVDPGALKQFANGTTPKPNPNPGQGVAAPSGSENQGESDGRTGFLALRSPLSHSGHGSICTLARFYAVSAQ